jgi:hypothetical protein
MEKVVAMQRLFAGVFLGNHERCHVFGIIEKRDMFFAAFSIRFGGDTLVCLFVIEVGVR